MIRQSHVLGVWFGKWLIDWKQKVNCTIVHMQSVFHTGPQTRLESQAASQTDCVITTFSFPDRPSYDY